MLVVKFLFIFEGRNTFKYKQNLINKVVPTYLTAKEGYKFKFSINYLSAFVYIIFNSTSNINLS